MEETLEDFFHGFRQELLASADAGSAFQLESFMELMSGELTETGFIEGFNFCHYRTTRGIRVDGYWFDDEGGLDLFVADFDCRIRLETLTRTDADAAFRRLENFFEGCIKGSVKPDVTTPEYGLALETVARFESLIRVRFHVLSERALSERVQAIPDGEIAGKQASYHIWDVTRIQRQRAARGSKEPLDINFVEMFGKGVNALPAHLDETSYLSYLIVIPAPVLAALYDKYSARLLEQNVRTFLQTRGLVNKGIRNTILQEPQKFFAYNNGISATAQAVEIKATESGLQIIRMMDLQIVNGGQTTASLYQAKKRDNADLSRIFVQMKLTVVDSAESEKVVPKISEYANTQNRVTAADFFSNQPFHTQMEGFSRRLWAPARVEEQRETHWFYERVRGQYADAQARLSTAEARKFKAEYPKSQMFSKTDLAKFDNVFDDHPRYVNLGSQKNFVQYAHRITKEWEKDPKEFNERYFKQAVARAILFRTAETIVSHQPWYSGGYRANIVAYSLSMLGEIARRRRVRIAYDRIWSAQALGQGLTDALEVIAREVNDALTHPDPAGMNVTEWAKREKCWDQMLARVADVMKLLPESLDESLVPADEAAVQEREARVTQVIDNGIEAQRRVLKIPGEAWRSLREQMTGEGLLSQKEAGVMAVAAAIPRKLPTPAQCVVLLHLLSRAREEGLLVS